MRSRRTAIILVAAIVVLVVPYFVPLDTKRLAVVAAVATAVAAIAALLSALASSDAARESSAAAQQAIRALSYAAKPRIELLLKEEEGRRYAVIENVSTHPAEKMLLRWSLTGGVQGESRVDDLKAMNLTSDGMSFGAHGPTRQVALPGFIPGEAARDSLTLTYAGSTGPTTWVVRYEFGPGVAKLRGYDNRCYRPSRFVSDEEADA